MVNKLANHCWRSKACCRKYFTITGRIQSCSNMCFSKEINQYFGHWSINIYSWRSSLPRRTASPRTQSVLSAAFFAGRLIMFARSLISTFLHRWRSSLPRRAAAPRTTSTLYTCLSSSCSLLQSWHLSASRP